MSRKTAIGNRGPIVVEPDDEPNNLERYDYFGSKNDEEIWGPFRGFSRFREKDFLDVFMKDMNNFDNNFVNLEKNLGTNGYTEVKKYSSFVEYKDGKIVKKDEKGVHLKNENGKGFLRVIGDTPEGRKEEKRKFDLRGNENLKRIK